MIDAVVSESPVATTVAQELGNPAGRGQRHEQMKTLIMPLLELGLSDSVIFLQFRGMYDADVEDAEINAIIEWGKNRQEKRGQSPVSSRLRNITAPEAEEAALKWLDGFSIEESDLWHASPIRPDQHWAVDSSILLSHLYRPQELVCINTRYLVGKKDDGTEKVTIIGPGETRAASEWIELIRLKGTPQDRAGAWIRLNPVRSIRGESDSGAHTDNDVAEHRYLLLESDLLSPEVALSVFGKLALPIAAIIDSGGRGPHAWVTLNAGNASEYRNLSDVILKRLARLGFDPANKNPSRYSRLAGAQRIIGAGSFGGRQKLYYVAPHLKPKGILS